MPAQRTFSFMWFLWHWIPSLGSSQMYCSVFMALHESCFQEQPLKRTEKDLQGLKKTPYVYVSVWNCLSEAESSCHFPGPKWCSTIKEKPFKYLTLSVHSGNDRLAEQGCNPLVVLWQTYRKNVQQMMQSLIRKLATLSQYEEVLAKISSTSTDRLTVLKTKPQSIQRDIITICSDPYTLAQQLTHIELVRLPTSQLFIPTDVVYIGNQIGCLSAVMSQERLG